MQGADGPGKKEFAVWLRRQIGSWMVSGGVATFNCDRLGVLALLEPVWCRVGPRHVRAEPHTRSESVVVRGPPSVQS